MTSSVAHDKTITTSERSVVMLTADRQIDRRILLQAESLENAGWTVTILAMPKDSGGANETPERWVKRIGQHGQHSPRRENFVLGVYRWVRNNLPMNGRPMRWMKHMAWRFLVKKETFYAHLFLPEAQHYRPTVFVAHDLPLLPVASKLAQGCNAKLVYDSHELYTEQAFSDWERRSWADIEARYIGLCDAVSTVNASLANELEQRYGLRDVQVIQNAERTRTLQGQGQDKRFHALLGLSADKKVLLLQGGITHGRNLDVLIEAMKYVRDDRVVLVVLGSGQLVQKLQNQAKSNALSHKVFFLPAVPQHELLAMTVAADAGVIPYQATCLNNYYCTPNKLFEFISAGLPIVASDLPEIRKMIEGHRIGMVGDTRSPQSFANLINDFFSDEARLSLWRSNLAIVRNSVCWEEEEKKLLKIYEAWR